MWLIQMYFYLNELLINCESLFTGAWCWEAGEEDKLWADWRGHFPGRIISAHTVSHFGIRTKWTKLRSVWVSGWHSEDVITQQPPVIHFIQVTVYSTGVHELLIDIDFSELHTHFEILVVGGFEVFYFIWTNIQLIYYQNSKSTFECSHNLMFISCVMLGSKALTVGV